MGCRSPRRLLRLLGRRFLGRRFLGRRLLMAGGFLLGLGPSFVWDPPKFRFVISEKSTQISRNFWAVTTCEEPYHNSKISSNFEL